MSCGDARSNLTCDMCSCKNDCPDSDYGVSETAKEIAYFLKNGDKIHNRYMASINEARRLERD